MDINILTQKKITRFNFLLSFLFFIHIISYGCTTDGNVEEKSLNFLEFFFNKYQDTSQYFYLHEENHLHNIFVYYQNAMFDSTVLNKSDSTYFFKLFASFGNNHTDTIWNWDSKVSSNKIVLLTQFQFNLVSNGAFPFEEQKKTKQENMPVPSFIFLYSKPYFNESKTTCIMLENSFRSQKSILVFKKKENWYLAYERIVLNF